MRFLFIKRVRSEGKTHPLSLIFFHFSPLSFIHSQLSSFISVLLVVAVHFPKICCFGCYYIIIIFYFLILKKKTENFNLKNIYIYIYKKKTETKPREPP